MTLAHLGVSFWHDLAAPIIAGIIASLIVNWLRNRKYCTLRASACRNGNMRPNQAAGANLAAFFGLNADKSRRQVPILSR